jgi:hypothetical protein
MEKELPEKFLLGMEALARGDHEEAASHLYKFSNGSRIFDSYGHDAIDFFLKPNQKRAKMDPETEKVNFHAIETIVKIWKLEEHKPYLALKSYCLTSNEAGVRRVINKVNPHDIESYLGVSQEPLLADSAQNDNPQITELLLSKGAWRGTSALRLAVSRAAKHNYKGVLGAILKKTPRKELDPTILRDGLMQSLIGKAKECCKKICQFAEVDLLEIWVVQVKSMQKEHEKDPFLPSYKEELKIITNEISKRKLMGSFDAKLESNNPQTLSIG